MRYWLIALALLAGCSEYAEPTLTPAQQKKVAANLLQAAPTPQYPVGAVIEDQIRLIGYDLDKTTVKVGETLTITWYLEALTEPMGDNKLFVHFQGRKNDRGAWMNLDHNPVEGLLPLRNLKKGQIVKDVQTLTLKPGFPGGTAHFYWGLWRGDTRLKIIEAGKGKAEADGRLKLAAVQVKGPRAKKAKRKALAMASRLKAGETITVDGKLDDAAWKTARPTRWWVAPDGSDRPVPKTRARFRWDDTHLYVGVESEDDDVWSTFKDRDANTWEQEVIELFIDADGDKKDYLELQVTPANVVFDAKFAKYRSDLAIARAWNMPGFKTAAHVDGTLNKRDDTDRGYSVEFAVPLAEVPGAGKPVKHGDTWRVNLFRWDFPKKGRQVASAFAPPMVGDFHALDRFGRLRFVDAEAARKAQPAVMPGLGKAPLKLPDNRLKRPLPGGGTASSPIQRPASAPASAAGSAVP
jgi:hypothetical protein